jgi:hypothetical protein
VTPQILKWGSWRGVGVVEGVVSGLLRSKGEGREPRTPQISNQIDATELVTLSLFSDKVPTETKHAMACRLCDCNDQSIQHNSTRSRKCSDVDITDKPLEAFIGVHSVYFFSILKLDSSFLSEEVSKWSELEAYKNSLKTAQAL